MTCSNVQREGSYTPSCDDLLLSQSIAELEQRKNFNNSTHEKIIHRPNNTWQHYFWTNDKKLIPKAVKFMEENGFIVRELNELKILREEPLKHIINDYLI